MGKANRIYASNDIFDSYSADAAQDATESATPKPGSNLLNRLKQKGLQVKKEVVEISDQIKTDATNSTTDGQPSSEASEGKRILGMKPWVFGLVVVGAGVAVWYFTRKR